MKRWMLALVMIGCAVPTTVPEETNDEGELGYETAEAKKAPPEAAAPAPLSASGSDGSGGGGGTDPTASPASVTFARATEERRYGVPIRDAAHKEPRVIFSVRLPSLRASERLRLRGEVTLSRCNTKDIAGDSGDNKTTPCNSKALKNDPYEYNPKIDATFVLADAPNDAKGRQIGKWVDHLCTEQQHHCALALPEVETGDLPDADEKYINLVVAADAPGTRARSHDVMEVELHHGGLYVTRIGAGAGARIMSDKSTHLESTGKLGIDQTEDEGDKTQVKRLLYQVKLEGLKPGDVIDASARMHATLDMSSLCDPLITGQIILTKDPGDREKNGPDEGDLTSKNGRNCVDHGPGGCEYEKSGAFQIDKGMPSTMFVSYIGMALRSCAAPGGADKWIVDDGRLAVGVTRAK
jgi:hypothetical protein